MSTRANVIIKSNNERLFFYKHSDGYPDGMLPQLNLFLKWVKEKKIRDNVQQAAGWLIIIGALEYNTIPFCEFDKPSYSGNIGYGKIDTIKDPKDWKCGSFEPTTGIHGDIDYLYIIDLSKKTIKCYEDWTEEGEGVKEYLEEKEAE